MSWFQSARVTVANGSKTVTVVSGESIENVQPEDGLIIGSFSPVEILKAYVDTSGTQIIELRNNWSDSSQTTVPARVLSTSGNFLTAVAELRKATTIVSNNYKTMDEFQTKATGTVEFESADGTKRTIKTLAQQALDNTAAVESATANISGAMNEVEFMTNVEHNIRKYAGSGFVEWGSEYGHSNVHTINKGMYGFTQSSYYNIYLGYGGGAPTGLSRSPSPLVSVSGIQHKLEFVGTSHTGLFNEIIFPPAPDGTKTYNSATGVTTKHATSNEAFEGLITNGDFRNGTTGWSSQGSGTIHTIVGGALKYENNGSYGAATPIAQNWEVGKEYRLKFRLVAVSGGNETNTGNLPDGSFFPTNGVGNYETTFIANGTDDLVFAVGGNKIGDYKIIDNISVMLVTESVVTSRKDLVFLETWHEDIESGAAREDIVYPLGNVQYNSTSYKGISLINNGKPQSYSAFGEWDTLTKGYGARWSDMSDAQKNLFINDPENNIYYDSEVKKFIQVRYRIRVIEGLGDSWENVRPTDNEYLQYDTKGNYVAPQGFSTTTVDFNPSYPVFVSTNKSDAALEHDNYIFGSVGGSSVKFGNAHNGKCFAVPIALVQRLNQGAYHPTYNSTGTGKQINDAVNGFVFWYESNARDVTSTAMTFAAFDNGGVKDTNSPANVGSINGGSALSGSSNQYKFYNAIYAGQVEDLRLDANKQDLTKLLEDSKRSDVAATTRGWGKVPFVDIVGSSVPTQFNTQANTIRVLRSALSLDLNNLPDDNAVKSCAGGVVIGGVAYQINKLQKSGDNHYRFWFANGEAVVSTGSVADLVVSLYLSAEYDSLPWVDIMGSPANIAATFPNGCVGQWIPKLPTGTDSYYVLNRKAHSVSGFTYQNSIGGGLIHQSISFGTAPNQVNPSTNELRITPATTSVLLAHYDSLSDFTAPSNNLPVLGKVGDVYSTVDYASARGNRLMPSLAGIIGKSNQSTRRYGEFKLDTHTITTNDALVGNEYAPKHSPLDFGTPANNSLAVKTLMGLTSKNGLIYPMYWGSQLKHNPDNGAYTAQPASNATWTKGVSYRVTDTHLAGYYRCINSVSADMISGVLVRDAVTGNISGRTSGIVYFIYISGSSANWGDDSTIAVVDKESTKTDDNGNVVKTFCHIGKSPIGIA